MSKKILAAAAGFLCSAVAVFAYDPPAGAEYMFRLVSPDMLSQAGSSAGGGFFTTAPDSITINPALTAGDQRIGLDAGYTALFSTSGGFSLGGAGQLGLLVPTRWGVFSGVLQGISADFEPLKLYNTVALRTGFAKDITDNLYAGAALNGSVNWGDGVHWGLGLDVGVWYRLGALGFLRDTRIGFSLANMGKPLVWGMPGIFTPRMGIAATLFSVKNLKGAFSADLSAPQFSNLVFDAGLQLQFSDMVTLKTGWQFNLKEVIAENYNLLPSVGVSVKFGINTTDNRFMAENGWQQSDLITSGAWQQLYGGVQAVSAAASLRLGLTDTEAPVIVLWGDEE
ncbi:hypothetical protein [Treponema brennaborense]|uniref:OmpA family protein n=1 Tax=Treponema brennaborense (strain DSM 12168 / CIP 105900 / DD5/3) TaxID=906968 RepID=F4LJ37_TREBD|nr:hypothetical protein [Treponema brennaborense]AEE16294.1 OmpA family protein [Treponema brennaborense DSM 12168]